MYRYFLTIITLISLTFPSYSEDFLEKKQWVGQIDAKNIVIDNQYGDVRLRHSGNKGEIEYLVTIQHLDNDNSLDIKHEIIDGSFILSSFLKFNQKVNSRADITLFIPENYPVTVKTNSGLIEAKGLKNNLQLTTFNGLISTKKINGSINTTNHSGQTMLVLNSDIITTQQFTSEVGSISILINESADFQISASTSSDIISDFSTIIEKHKNNEPNKTAKISINKSKNKLIILSKHGDIAIRERRNY